MLNYMYNLCPLTQSTCLTNIGCSASEFVDGKLVSEAENGYLDLFFLWHGQQKSQIGEYNRKGILYVYCIMLKYTPVLPLLHYD